MIPTGVKSPTSVSEDHAVTLESVLCTEELSRRPSRSPDYETENRALAKLVQALADSPGTILQTLADTILEVFQADSAGLSLLTTRDGGKRFYWPAIAGAWKPHIGGGTPREFGPCGDVLDRNAPLLFRRFERRYPYLLPATPPAEEALFIPFYVHGKAVGTIWAMAHDERRRFDAEDLRQLESLGRFASAAYQAVHLQQADDSRRAALNLMEDAVRARQAVEKLNQKLRESEERFRTLADNIAQFAWTADVRGWIYWYNQRWYDYTGTTLQEMQGWGWKKVLHRDHVDRVVERIQHSWDTGEPWEDTFPLRGKDGEYRWFLSRALPIRDEQGNVLCWFGTNTDVTERREMENQITQQAEQLAGESRRKDEFLAMLSHELRNPLAPIRTAVHLLKLHEGGSKNPIQRQAREIIERQTANLTKLVGDLLEVSRVVSGRIRLNQQTVDINQVVRHAIETATPLIDDRKHKLVLNLPSDPVWVNADATRMEEVLINLLNNAAKYTPDGGRIEVYCEQARGRDTAQVRVRDNGVGIEPELLRGGGLFDLFTQADRSLARSSGGLGIGLSLAHRLVALHGGTIEAKSPPEEGGQGSEFIVTLTLAPAPESVRPSAPTDAIAPGAAEGVRVLVVDDNIDQAMMLATALRGIGYSVQTAYNGPDGLKTARQWRPDVVVLDIGLPGLDGYQVARQLRSDAVSGGARLIALTGYASDTDIALAREAGFDAHLVKPCEIDELEQLMLALLANVRASADHAA